MNLIYNIIYIKNKKNFIYILYKNREIENSLFKYLMNV